MLYLTNISIDLNMSLKDFGYEAAILYIFTMKINFLSRSVAKRKGWETGAHKKAFDLVEKFGNEIIEKGLRGQEGEYCRNLKDDELRFTRQAVLSFAGINLEDFESTYLMYSNRELLGKKEELGFTEYQLKTIR